jgi:hypothetical protein
MLEIINQRGEILELSDDVAIPVEKNNTLFSDDLLQDLSYNETAPLSANNKKFIQNAHLLTNDDASYQIWVSVSLNSEVLFTGLMQFRIKDDKLDFTLKPNYSSVATLAASGSLNQIDVGDQQSDLTAPQLIAVMNDTLNNPQNYNYVFAPVYHTRFFSDTLINNIKYLNERRNSFDIFNPNPSFYIQEYNDVLKEQTQQVAFPKLLSVLKIIGRILGYNNIEGSWKDTEEAQTTCVFNLNPCSDILGAYNIPPIGLMLPDLSISDFLKAIKKRFNLSFDFDNKSQTFIIESFESSINQEPIDLSKYIQKVTEIDIPKQKGYKINLKVDKQDKDWNTGTEDEPIYIPQYDLLIGDEKEAIEIPVGTLRPNPTPTILTASTKLTISDYAQTGEDAPYNAANKLDLRVFKFNIVPSGGFNKDVTTSSLDITLKHASYYNFLNYSRTFKIIANVPQNVLSQMKSNSLFTFTTENGEQVQALNVKTEYDLKDTSYTRVLITCRSTSYKQIGQPVLRDNYATLGDGDFILTYYKSNFVNLTPTITAKIGSNFVNLTTPANRLPCDKFGVGGRTQPCYTPTGTTPDLFTEVKFTITQGLPIELRYLSKRIPFALQPDGSYTATITGLFTRVNGLAFFVVF